MTPSPPPSPAADPGPDAAAAGAYFGRDLEAMSFAVNYHRWLLARLAPYVGRRVAEVGAGTGNVTRLLLETFPGVERLWAFEPSANMYPQLARALADEPRARAVRGFFGAASEADAAGADTDIPPPGALDTVAYINVLEHIHDDTGELARAHARLAPGGHLLVFVPALPALYSRLDAQLGHARRYRRRELVDKVRAAGFAVEVAEYFDVAGILPWYVSFTLLGNELGAGNVTLYDRLVVPLMRRIEDRVRPPVGKNVLLVARRLPE